MNDTAIHVEELYKKYGNVEAIRGITFQVRQGEIFGLIGPDGAGMKIWRRKLARRDARAEEGCTAHDIRVSRVEYPKNWKQIIQGDRVSAVPKRDAGGERPPHRFGFYRAECMWAPLWFC